MSSSTAAAGTTISQAPTTRGPDRITARHESHHSTELGRPLGRRAWSDFAEDAEPRPTAS